METEPKSTAEKLVDSTLLIAGASLLLYLVCASFLNGYLSFFGAQPDWFSPSLFQLVSFCYLPILISALLAVGNGWLVSSHSGPALLWWLIYLLWLGGSGAVFWLYSTAMAAFSSSPISTAVLIIYGIFALTPIAIRSDMRHIRSKRITARPPANTIAITPESISELRAQAANARRVFRISQVVGYCWFLTFFANAVGWAQAGLALGIIQSSKAPGMNLLFTDGTNTLTCKSSPAGATRTYTFVYKSPASGLELTLTTPHQMATLTMPATSSPATANATTTTATSAPAAKSH